MDLSRVELKASAKEKLKGKWGEPLATTAAYAAISFVASFVFSFIIGILMIPIATLIVALAMPAGEDASLLSTLTEAISSIFSWGLGLLLAPLTIGFFSYFLSLAKNDENKNILNIFEGYKKAFGTSVLAVFLKGVYTFLWTLVFIVPGIIKSYAYAMTEYIIADDPSVSASEAIKKSQEMMNGHKWEFCVLQLSFLGWGILATFTCGIGYLWLIPYMQTTTSNFYLQIKEEYETGVQVI